MLVRSQYLEGKIERYDVLPKLPRQVSRFLGYRPGKIKGPPEWQKLVTIFLATMAGMLVNFAVVQNDALFTHHWHFTSVVPSFAASCILIYGSIDAPLSQPRNLFFGHFASGLIGVCVMKLFMTNSKNGKYLWLSGSLSVSAASVVMDILGIVHPPAGATALLPSVDDSIRHLGWNYLPALLIESLLFLAVALLCNNVVRRYPRFWICAPTAAPPPAPEDKSALEEIIISENQVHIPDSVHITSAERELLEALHKRLRAELITP